MAPKADSKPAGVTKRRKRAFRLTKPKYTNVKKPGFDAFTVKQVVEDENGTMVDKHEVVAPETGIHSLAWSLAIEPQPGTLLSLPYEIRVKIYTYCLQLRTLSQPIIRPSKNGKKFVSKRSNFMYGNFPDLTHTILRRYNTLSLISRQAYVDVVGGGLLYAVSKFSFDSPQLMTNYLLCINPAHKALIRTVKLGIRILDDSNIPKKVFSTLASIPALHSLELELIIKLDLCVWTPSIRDSVIGSHILTRIQDNKNWELLSGVRNFTMTFMGWNKRRKATSLSEMDQYVFVRETIRQKICRR